ncbi:amidase [Actinocorallia sp. B10E7]|uniref:amidase n=1 Tax=Actinocorallia sp. B10E7 TaxID=3153558 RepID=UPI00325C8A4D
MQEIDPMIPWLSLAPDEPPVPGPLAGLSFVVKDVIDVAGLPTGAGNPRWLDTHPVPDRDAAVVTRLREAGASLSGKTHTDELAYSLAGTNHHYGSPRNPAAPGHLTGGSSSGSASAVASGLADIGLGTDTAGSCRVPAAFTGLHGLRPTHSRVPRDGCVPLAPSFDVPGLLTRTLGTLRLAAGALLDPRPEHPAPLWLLLPDDLWHPVPPELKAALSPVLTELRSLLKTDRTPLFRHPDTWSQTVAAFSTVQGFEAWAAHGEWITRESPRFGPGVASRFARAAKITPAEAAEARTVLDRTAALLRSRLRHGVLAVPTAPLTPPPLAEPGDRTRILPFTCLASVAGAPALSLPAATVDGLPLALSLIGPPDSDEHLLDLAGEREG